MVSVKTIIENGVTCEQYELRGIRKDLGMQIDNPQPEVLYSIYTRLGSLYVRLGIN